MSASLVGWMFRKLDDQTCVYRLQLTATSKRLVNKLTQQIGGTIVGEGYGSVNKQTVLIFEKVFENQKEWIKFADYLLSKNPKRVGGPLNLKIRCVWHFCF